MNFLYLSTIFFFVFVCFFLCFIILIQESKSSGLGASFGGESGDSLFGSSTPDVLKKVTGYLAIAFFVFCLFLSFWTSALAKSDGGNSNIDIDQVTTSE